MDQDRWSLFKCQRCGRCCEKLGLPWDGNIIEKMAKFLKMNPEDVITRFYGDIIMDNGERAVKLDRNRTTPCPFLGKDKSCQIYPVRPSSCEAYPIETDFGRCGVDCPAMKIVDETDFEEEGEKMSEFYLKFFPESKPNGLSCAPFAEIRLRSWSRDKEGGVILASMIHSFQELKWWLDIIRKDCDAIERIGRKKLP